MNNKPPKPADSRGHKATDQKSTLTSFPIGVNWTFSPASQVFQQSSDSCFTFPLDVWSLPLEPLIAYGGPVQQVSKLIGTRFQIALRSQWRAFIPTAVWDPVHRAGFETLAADISPAYIFFERADIKRIDLVEFEREIYKVTDTTVVLPLELHWQSGAVTFDELWFKDLTAHTRMQASINLPTLLAAVEISDLTQFKDSFHRATEMIFKDPLRIAEIQMSPDLTAEKLALQFELWRDLAFDHGASATVIWDWDDSRISWKELKRWMRSTQALRSGMQSLELQNMELPVIAPQTTRFLKAFAAVFTKLVAAEGLNHLRSWIGEFEQTLSQQELEIHESMRQWPMYLKSHAKGLSVAQKKSWIELSNHDWAVFSARFHPTDERAEKSYLQADELKLNPTVHPIMTDKQMLLIFRRHHVDAGELAVEREATWAEAAVIDEIKENFKLKKSELVRHLLPMTSPAGQIQTAEFWSEVIQLLIRDGVVLGESDDEFVT